MGDLACQLGAHGTRADDADAARCHELVVNALVGLAQPFDVIPDGLEGRGIGRTSGNDDIIGFNPLAVLQRHAIGVHAARAGAQDLSVFQQPVIGNQGPVRQRGVDDSADHRRRMN